jgi:hypothetical protein
MSKQYIYWQPIYQQPNIQYQGGYIRSFPGKGSYIGTQYQSQIQPTSNQMRMQGGQFSGYEATNYNKIGEANILQQTYEQVQPGFYGQETTNPLEFNYSLIKSDYKADLEKNKYLDNYQYNETKYIKNENLNFQDSIWKKFEEPSYEKPLIGKKIEITNFSIENYPKENTMDQESGYFIVRYYK